MVDFSKGEHVESEQLRTQKCRHVWDTSVSDNPQCVRCGIMYRKVNPPKEKADAND